MLASAGLALALALVLLTWLVSLMRHDVSLVDRVWALSIVGAGWVYFALGPDGGARSLCMLMVASVWALRLSAFITWRNWGHGEDRRYRQMRARNQPHFGAKSLYLVFLLQAVLAWVVSAPLLASLGGHAAWGVLDIGGLVLASFGVLFEGVADMQLARFKADPRHRGQVMDGGLWRYTRHPNYFGEACVWWGLGLAAIGGGGWSAGWCLLSPWLMTVLLLRVSGVRLLEQDIGERRPGYGDYVARTNAFLPGRPR